MNLTTAPSLLVVPNLSDGRRPKVIDAARSAMERSGVRVLDVHSDPVHDRSVLTAAGDASQLMDAATGLATAAARLIDLRRHRGVHPRSGALDLFPFVPLEGRSTMDEAIAAALSSAAAIAEAGIPVYLYGLATDPPRPLPELRHSVSEPERMLPDLGPHEVDPSTGVVCVGARGILIAFNVWLAASVDQARAIAGRVRERDGGSPGVRALGLAMGPQVSQVSMNLTDPRATGIDEAFEAVRSEALRTGAEILETEIVGLVPERFLPAPDKQAARLLKKPGRSLESVLATI